ncbi:MAG TPA: hypothetical protein VJ746_09520 [Nitrospira sp.]|nr:hypothetical protein [Nitrospira sp.]
MKRIARLLVVLLFLHGVVGCLPHLQASPRAQADAASSRCHSSPALRDLTSRDPVPRAVANAASVGPFLPPLSMEARRTAVQIGLPDVLAIWPSIKEQADETRRSLAMIALRQALNRRLALVASDVMSTMAAIDCEAARSDHVADAVAETHQDISERALFAVFASDIFIGIIPGALMLAGHNVAAEINEVFGGVVGTAFGSVDAVLHVEQDFRHPQNFLGELWEGPARSQLFPASVWRFLNDASEEDPRRTVRQVLLARWHTDGRWDRPELMPQAAGKPLLLLSDGGRYGQRPLRMRSEMLRQLGSEVLHLGLAIHRLKYELTQWLDAQSIASLQTHQGRHVGNPTLPGSTTTGTHGYRG